MEMIYIPSMEVCSVPGLALAKVAHGTSHLRQRQPTGVCRRPTTRRRSPRVRVTWTPTRVGAGEAGGTAPTRTADNFRESQTMPGCAPILGPGRRTR